MPLISVILPVYNGEKTIYETINSVVNQTFIDWELIVINDGSQDSTLDIIKSFSDSRLQVFSYPNAGLAISRNRGVIQANGNYISFIDADDIWTPHKLEFQIKALQENSEASVAYSWCDHIDIEGKFLRTGSRITANGNIHAKLLLANFLENGSNPLVCKQALISIGGFEASLNPAEDWDLWLRLALHYQFVTVPYPQILYRVSPNSMSSNVVKMELASLQVIERAFSQAPQSLQYLKKSSFSNLYKYLLYKTLESFSEKKAVILTSTRFLWNAVKSDPSMLKTKIFLKILFKIISIALLNYEQSQALFQKFSHFSNTSTLLAYLKI
ncbi:glycosyltransferase [Nostoc sp. UHCC 0302]|uniref:glycosyltransferase n=1 Tax=Nostoc sp. UHCC 0302 TaxID=3134896 RepID=UPI00311CA771